MPTSLDTIEFKSASHPRRTTLYFLQIAILLVAAVIFVIRTVAKPGQPLWDYAMYSAQSRAWVLGHDPYDEPALKAAEASDGADARAGLPPIDSMRAVAPPTLLTLVGPFTLLPRRAGMRVWAGVSTGLFLAAAVGLGILAKVRSWPLFFAGILLLSPLQLGLLAGQPAVPCVALMVLAFLVESRGLSTGAGVLLGIAIGLKPQLAAGAVVYFAVVSNWTVVVGSVLTVAANAGVAILRMHSAGVHWLQHWQSNVAGSCVAGSTNDYSTLNPTRDHLLNLQVPFYAMFGSRTAANLSAGACFLALAIAYFYLLRRRSPLRRPGFDLRRIAPLAPLALVPFYHRYYDGSVLVLPLALLLAPQASLSRRIKACIAVLLIPFVLPVGWATNLVNKHYIPIGLTHHLAWNVGVMSILSWASLGLGVALLRLLATDEVETPR